MADQSNFPTSLDDTPEDKVIGDAVPVSAWNTYMDAIVNLEEKVGIDQSAVTNSIDYQMRRCPPLGFRSRVVQSVYYETGEGATGATVVPEDDTIPQANEGDQFMSCWVTPTCADHLLRIDVVCHLANNTYATVVASLYLSGDSSNDALGSGAAYSGGAGITPCVFTVWKTAGSSALQIYQVRGGSSGGTTTFNGEGGSRLYGGVLKSTITITEFADIST